MTIALAVAVNATAGGLLLALLTAVMRLPYHLPGSGQSAAAPPLKDGVPSASRTWRDPSDRRVREPAYSR